ncbi:putative mannosyl-oligosaccharide glucosidase [Wickerhamiella sorbophila]|uniref:Mannosyl-oligosaccharide glucosidase n=1 Tax=Wickerhamiella sorbophila TaxID=45607 RepID=A0A2T0FEW8_9ASCO|nr:putative mannosyl-oligosaccharide glucosidase [Wickerhamiella sorbophila]PRT53520.1 putative mannosyl-oligosaccharide glucosidase [Wickerhamiella sorbophila]
MFSLVVALLLSVAFADPLLWGPYRPNVYFGMRPRIPHSLISGLMWYNANDIRGINNLRHDVTMDNQGVTFGWDHYDPRLGGQQTIVDKENSVTLRTTLLKSENGDSWVVRVEGDQSPDAVLSLVYYTAIEGDGDLQLKSMLTAQGIKGDTLIEGSSPELGRFDLKIVDAHGSHPESSHPVAADRPGQNTQYAAMNVPNDNAWRARQIFLTLAQEHVNQLNTRFPDAQEDIPAFATFALANTHQPGSNFHMVQKSFQGPFAFDIEYGPRGEAFKYSVKAFDKLKSAQQAKFDTVFKPRTPFKAPEFTEFARQLVSNLAAGLGYFYGDSLVGDPDNRQSVDKTEPKSLLTFTPTRAFFPRGFYWDEGFHLIGLFDYDPDLCLQVISSWFSNMDEDGWIGREQILGPEARSRVPEEFQVQYPDYANPPTILMMLAQVGSAKQSPASIKLLKDVYPALKQHFKWFRSSQQGDIVGYDREPPSLREGYRWRGRTPTHVLTSGFDDYPRASEPSDGELHVDLLSWVGAMARSLAQIADVLGESKDAERFAKIQKDVQSNLVALHWSSDQNTFCDVAVDEFEEDVHVCHPGYVSHLPFFLRLVDAQDEKRLLSLIHQLRDEDQLWSNVGIRSLSKSDGFFGIGENYWRGPVWINMNYLALEALQYYHEHGSEAVQEQAAKLFNELRRNVVNNVYKQWKTTGAVWEQYDSMNGAAKGAKQFTGWTALVANIINMPELDAGHREL